MSGLSFDQLAFCVRYNIDDFRSGIPLSWENVNPNTNCRFVDFEDYLSCFKSKRRIKIKAERRKVYEDQVGYHMHYVFGYMHISAIVLFAVEVVYSSSPAIQRFS